MAEQIRDARLRSALAGEDRGAMFAYWMAGQPKRSSRKEASGGEHEAQAA